jgi:hypothetical protein
MIAGKFTGLALAETLKKTGNEADENNVWRREACGAKNLSNDWAK